MDTGDDFLRDLEERLGRWRSELETLETEDSRVWEEALIEIAKEKTQQMRLEIADYEAVVAKLRAGRP